MTDVDVAVLGAGPHGLAAAAHVGRVGADVQVLGDPMSFWRTMPKGMVLRSSWTASCIAEHEGALSLDAYCAETGARIERPVPLERFLDYGLWVQQKVAPDVLRRDASRVESTRDGFRLELDDGQVLRARRVVVATGISPFVHRPEISLGLPRELVSHTADHDDLSRMAGRRVLVVGGGQSALESAALLHEAGADVEVVVRRATVNWLAHTRAAAAPLSRSRQVLRRGTRLLYAPTDVGPAGLSRLVAAPELFRRLPRRVQDPAAYRSIRPAGAGWLRPRLEAVPIRTGTSPQAIEVTGDELCVRLSDGTRRTVDHVLFGTGYRVDVTRYPFLDPALVRRLELVRGYPVLRRGLESSVPGLHFVGAPAAWSFGPTMRFVAGSWFAGRTVAATVAAQNGRRRSQSPSPALP